jgi:hypothetical protein
MSAKLPPLPKSQPPVIESGNEFPLSRLIPIPVRAWFVAAMVTGLAAGFVKGAWRTIVDKDPDLTILCYAVIAFAVLGVAGISYCWCRMLMRPSVERFLGMKRFYWLLGVPLAWLCGVGIGLCWRYI